MPTPSELIVSTSDDSPVRSAAARSLATAALVLLLVAALAVAVIREPAPVDTLAPGAAPVPGLAAPAATVLAPRRPTGADAAERWWTSCMAGLPASADALERRVLACW